MIRSALFLASLLTTPLAAQTAPPPPAPPGPPAPAAPPEVPTMPPPGFMQAAQAYGGCIGSGAGTLPSTVTPEAGARQLVTACAAQKTAMETQFETWVAGPTFPAAGRDMARAQFKTQMDGVEAQVAARIRASRAGPTAPTTPSAPPAALAPRK